MSEYDYGAATTGRIAIVTVAIFERGAETSACEEDDERCLKRAAWAEATVLTVSQTLAYARHHGYAFYVMHRLREDSMEVHWEKITALRAVLDLPFVDTVLFIDSDAMFRSPTTRVEDLVARMGNHSVMVASHRENTSEECHRELDWPCLALNQPDCEQFAFCAANTGVVLMRDDAHGRKVLDDWTASYQKAEPKTGHFYWATGTVLHDQAGFNIYVMQQNWDHILLVDKTVMNSLSPQAVIVHVKGVSPIEKRKKLLNHVVNFAEQLLIPDGA